MAIQESGFSFSLFSTYICCIEREFGNLNMNMYVTKRQIKISARGIGPEAHNREIGGFNSLLAAADVNNL